MKKMHPGGVAAAFMLALAAAPAFAHITLSQQSAPAASDYDASFRVGHACAGAGATTGVTARLPEGFTLIAVEPRDGWTLTVTPKQVQWLAGGPAAAISGSVKTTFNLRGRLPATPGTLYFKVRQDCDVGSADWAELPTRDGDKPDFPAAKLEVLPAGGGESRQ
ncbi:DUF1775 domain-containing protein [Derxia gummosa]|uniref:DUF1775 domain-containing protein n=1 Tax=Derxia gummosa DSM 723 TaxID=1121388 RepID=A0A9U5CZY6_9BURK|nr:DUF1775 domain-containing protein [Derxia gummosa]